MTRYYTQSGSYPEIKACFHLSGPQAEDQVNKEVKDILDKPGIKSVAVLYDHGLGDRIEIFSKIPEGS